MVSESSRSTAPSFAESLTLALMNARDAESRKRRIVRAFDGLHRDNPLRNLTYGDQKSVWVFLMVFAELTENPDNKMLREINKLSHSVSIATKAATSIEKQLRTDHGKALNRRLMTGAGLAVHLKFFAKQVGGPLDRLGKTGLKIQRAIADHYLISASELVFLRTGGWYYEFLGDLLRALRPEARELSGEAIRRRRERFKRAHPEFHQAIVRRISRTHRYGSRAQ